MAKKIIKAERKQAAKLPLSQAQQAKSLLNNRYTSYVLVGLLLLIVSLIYFPVAFQHKAPIAGDITQWRGAANSIIEYNQTHKDNALWTNNMFSGMPAYLISFPNRYPFLESFTKLTDKVINWRIFLLFVGGLGIFILLRHMKMNPWIAFFGAIAFIFSCHWVGLIEIGHNTKFRAAMYIPWVIWSIMRLKEKPGILNLGLAATFLITQLRENHPQISYYLYLFIGMYWVYSLIESFRDKDTKKFASFTGLLILAFGLTVLAVMNPYLSTMEYSHYTMRGGSAGLDKAYAQGWSFHPLEIIGFIIPDFFGGINQNYWGYMPFTQIYNYFGLVVLVFGLLALTGKHKRFAIFLWIASAIFTIMSFGEFAPFISDLLLKYLPYFNKFRVPSMILVMTQIIGVILAALGVDTVVSKAEEDKSLYSKFLLRTFWIAGAIFMLWLIGAKTVFKGLPFVNEGTLAQLQQQEQMAYLPQLQAERLALLYKSGITSLLFAVVGLGLAYLHTVKKLKASLFILLITLLAFIDLWLYTGKHLKNTEPVAVHQERFAKTDYDEFLLSDKSNFRIYPFNMTQVRPEGEWAFYHQSVVGYSAAKLKRYDDILRLINGDPKLKRDGEFIRYLKGVFEEGGREKSTPVMDMLATKYVILADSLPYAQFLNKYSPAFASQEGVYVYQNQTALPKAWFVSSQKLFANADSVYAELAKGRFEPRREAFVEDKGALIAGAGDSLGVNKVELKRYELQNAEYALSTDREAFLVLSETYYPAGWKALLDGKEIPIYATNYILRGLKIPAGNHKLELVFAPESYKKSLMLSLAGILITLASLALGFFLDYKSKPARTA